MNSKIVSVFRCGIAEIRLLNLRIKGNKVKLGFYSRMPLSFQISVAKNATINIGKSFIANPNAAILVRGVLFFRR